MSDSPLKRGATAGLSSSAGSDFGENTAGQASSGTRHRRGIVLLLVVVVVLMLSLSGLAFVSFLYSEHKAVHLSGDEIQAEQLAGSGVELLKAFLTLPPAQQAELGGLEDNPDHFRGVLVVGERKRHGRFSILSPKRENPESTETSGIRFGLENESAKLNLGVLPEWERAHPDAGRQALMRLPGMTEVMADAILDWVDADAAPRPQGAEEDYYVGVGAPYAPRNAPPTSLEELLLVREVNRRLLFGTDTNWNYRIDPNEKDSGSPSATVSTGRGEASVPWASLLTVQSAERNTTPEGKPRVDLNGKDLNVVYQQLTAMLPEPWARFIIAYRQYGPAKVQGSPPAGLPPAGPPPAGPPAPAGGPQCSRCSGRGHARRDPAGSEPAGEGADWQRAGSGGGEGADSPAGQGKAAGDRQPAAR